MKKVLIIGSYGFIGKYLKKKLKKNFNLICPKRGVNFNIKNKKQLKKIINQNISVIINLSGQIQKNKKQMYDTIVKGNKNIVEIVKELKKNIRIYYFSTTLVYGYSPKILDETSNTNPISSYSKYKRIAENNYINSNINYKILRVANVYSKNKAGIINNIFNYFKKDKKILVTNLNVYRNYIHILDLVNIFSKIINKKLSKNIYNIGNENKSIRDIFYSLEKKINKKISFKNKKMKLKNLSSHKIKKSKLLKEINYQPKIDLLNYLLKNI